MITKEFAHEFAAQWIEAWNTHDLAQVLSHYTEDFEMTSPYILTIASEPSGTLKGKDKVGAYWHNALGQYSDLRFELIDVLYSMRSVTIYYHSVSKDKKVAEFFLFDESGKACKVIAHYA